MKKLLFSVMAMATSLHTAVMGSDQTALPVDLRGVAIDGKRNIYLADYTHGAIHKFGPDGRQQADVINGLGGILDGYIAADQEGNVYFSIAGAGHPVCKATLTSKGYDTQPLIEGLRTPAGIAIDTDGKIYVADRADSTIRKFDHDGKNPQIVVSPPVQPDQIAVGKDKTIYFTAIRPGGQELWKATSQPSASGYTTKPIINSDIQGNPTAVAVDSDANLYVSYKGSNTVHKCSPEGKVIQSFFADAIDNPGCLAVDGNTFYVAVRGKLLKYDSSYRINNPNHCKVALFPGDEVTGITIDNEFNIYAVNPSAGTIVKYDSNGNLLVNVATGLRDARGVTVDGNGNVFFTDNAGGGAIWKAAWNGGKYDAPKKLANDLGFLWGIAMDGSGNIYVAATERRAVYKLNYECTRLTPVALELSEAPVGVGVDRSGSQVYFSTRTDLPGGTLWKATAGPGGYDFKKFAGGFKSDPYGVGVDPSGTFVCVTNRTDISYYWADGQFWHNVPSGLSGKTFFLSSLTLDKGARAYWGPGGPLQNALCKVQPLQVVFQ